MLERAKIPGVKKDGGSIHMERNCMSRNQAGTVCRKNKFKGLRLTAMQAGNTSLDLHGKERYVIVILSLLLAAMVTWFLMWKTGIEAGKQMQEHLAGEVLRFHILANSDSEEDQALKITVRDRILDYLKVEMPETKDAKETARWIRRHMDELEALGRRTVAEQGYDYPVNAAVTTCWFPDRTYGDLIFPAGNYEALRIELGDADGHNWWCVLYPSLCFQDAANAVFPEESKQKLQNVLVEEEYAQMTAASDFQIKWYFWERWKG